uniref:Uncharacterized protein n=1 Tax=Varanus komodoensis TaxID=61221 RepID=A0A8D2J4Y5_VARKO
WQCTFFCHTLTTTPLFVCVFCCTGLLVRGADFNQAAENYTVCQGDNTTLR